MKLLKIHHRHRCDTEKIIQRSSQLLKQLANEDRDMETEKTTVFERHPVKMAESESVSENKREPKSLRQRWKDHRDQIVNRVSRFPLTNISKVGISKQTWRHGK